MWFRLVSLVFLFACIWVGVEIYAHGTAGAFGGALSGFAEAHGDARSPLERIQGSATGARDRQLSRIEHQLSDPSVGLRDESADPED